MDPVSAPPDTICTKDAALSTKTYEFSLSSHKYFFAVL